MVVGLELMRERVVRETERRLAGDLLAEALGGRLDSDELRGRLRPFGIGAEAAVLVFELEDPHAGEQAAGGWSSPTPASPRWSRPAPPRGGRCSVRGDRRAAPAIRSRSRGSLRSALAGTHGQVRAAASRRTAVGSLRRAFHEARCALEATSLADGDAPEVASHQDLGRLHAAALAPGRGRAAALQRRPAGADRAHRGRVRRRAAALARGLHRAQRQLGAGRPRSSTATATRCATGSARSRS